VYILVYYKHTCVYSSQGCVCKLHLGPGNYNVNSQCCVVSCQGIVSLVPCGSLSCVIYIWSQQLICCLVKNIPNTPSLLIRMEFSLVMAWDMH